tara:strand:- start:128 stop:430 length:303 start_codon:yes stop_codon:yes gene_type:complete
MAKRKTPKKNRILDLNPKPEKIEAQELLKLQSLIKGINKAQAQIGMIEVQKHSVLNDIMEMRGYLANIQKEFQEKYNSHDVNLENGTINYNKNGSNEINS